MAYVLLFSVFVIATCGLVYELIAGALASYLLGDSVTQFSTVIGVYLFSMGIGSFLSKYITRNLVFVFIEVEILIGLVGGTSAALLFAAFEHVTGFRVLLYATVAITGILVGLEIPLLMRILKSHFEFKDLIAKVFTFDYIGALLASLLFPLILVPRLGLVRSGFLFGIINVLVGLWALYLFRHELPWVRLLRGSAITVLIGLVLGFVYADRLVSWAEAAAYRDKVIYAKSSKHQRIVLTHAGNDLRLYLNGNLQFSSRDEYRYHEALVHMGLASLARPEHVLILGGGDGLAAREVLRYPSVQSITLVDLDAAITSLFATHETLVRLNHGALTSPKVSVVNADAFVWLREPRRRYDFIVVDLPDPTNYSIGKLYTNSFYRLLHAVLKDDGVLVVQSTSPYVAPRSFWCIDRTLQSVGFVTTPYHAYVPSFGDWGYTIATKRPFTPPTRFPEGLRFVDVDTARHMLHFPDDMRREVETVNKLNNQLLVRYFEEEWSEYVH